MIRGVFHRSVDENRTEQLNNAMHWAYGTSCGVYGLAQRSLPQTPGHHRAVFADTKFNRRFDRFQRRGRSAARAARDT